MQQGLRQLPQGSLPSSGVRGSKGRGPISLAVTGGIVGTASVEAAEERTSLHMQKPPFRVGEKLYRGAYLSSSKVAEMEEAPAGLQTRLTWDWADYEYHDSGQLAWPPHQR